MIAINLNRRVRYVNPTAAENAHHDDALQSVLTHVKKKLQPAKRAESFGSLHSHKA